jgi:serine/threonine protein kinase/tetratricopeptide (TPR) repeat protein
MVNLNNVKSIFLAAIEMPPAERADFLNEAVAGDAALRERVEALLSAHDDPKGFLDKPAAQFGAAVDLSRSELPPSERLGTAIGPYKLVEQIGEGGMGVVYLADQQTPVRRRVALKIIKPGMDTRQVIARFEAERQALALMDHSNIARVLDAGATDSGRPYFVMELVHGTPITDYCVENNLSVHERLELFVQVCRAVQHAHQKGIIHRDLKPSNVLVTLDEGRPAPKVIDFGVAKAINQQLTEKTIFTTVAQLIGTPLYMSPEQAETTTQDIDTRSDIYSLGVILYELLTGTTPFDKQRLAEAAYEEVRRIIRDEEPPRPSTRIRTVCNSRAPTPADRLVDSRQLIHLVHGDLDWIVMKALEKDRNRRYETAESLARDIQRYLSDQPVEACPPSATYRFRKFARRNRVALSMAAIVSASLVFGTVASAWQAIRATRAERLAEAARTAEAEQRTEAETQREHAEANFQRAHKTVDHYFTLVSESKLLDVPGLQTLRTDLLESALDFYRELVNQRSNDPAVLADLAATYLRVAVVYGATDRNDDAVAALLQGLEIVEQLRHDHPAAAEHHRKLAGFWKGRRSVQRDATLPRDPLEAFQALQKLTSLWEKFVEENPAIDGFQSDLAANYATLADLQISSGHREEGLAFLRKSRAGWDRLARDYPAVPEYRADLARACEDLAGYLPDFAQSEEAREEFLRALTLREQLAKESPDVPQRQLDLAESLKRFGDLAARTGKFPEAEQAYRRAVNLSQDLVDRFPTVPLHSEQLVVAQNELMKLLESTGQVLDPQAEQSRRRAIDGVAKLVDNFPTDGFFRLHLARCYRDLAKFLVAHDRPHDAIAAHRQAKQLFDSLPSDHPSQSYYRSMASHTNADLGLLLIRSGQSEEGEKLYREAMASFARLVAEFPENLAYVRDLEECRRRAAAAIGEGTSPIVTDTTSGKAN